MFTSEKNTSNKSVIISQQGKNRQKTVLGLTYRGYWVSSIVGGK